VKGLAPEEHVGSRACCIVMRAQYLQRMEDIAQSTAKGVCEESADDRTGLGVEGGVVGRIPVRVPTVVASGGRYECGGPRRS